MKWLAVKTITTAIRQKRERQKDTEKQKSKKDERNRGEERWNK
jgi:hypothetical protein